MSTSRALVAPRPMQAAGGRCSRVKNSPLRAEVGGSGRHPRNGKCRCAKEHLPAPASEAAGGIEPSVEMVSLGCAKNTVDGEVMLGDLASRGYRVREDGESDGDSEESSRAVIINTCAFVEDAKNESLEAIFEAVQKKNEGRTKKVIVTGCLAQRYSKELSEEIPEADLIVGFENYSQLSEIISDRNSREEIPKPPLGDLETSKSRLANRIFVGSPTVPFRSEAKRYRLTPLHSAYLRVAEGCDHKCTFCAIPSFRGKFRSKPFEAVIDEAKRLADSGAKELNLIAEDTNQYGIDRRAIDERGLGELMEKIAEINGIEWIRILYAYPSYFTDDLIQAIADIPQVCKYIDIPLQHIANLSLLKMNRPPKDHTTKLLDKLRDRIPGLALRTTFISGFPGETEEEHRELVKFVKSFKFERLGAFAYSQEDGTPAANYPEQLSQEVKDMRRDEIISAQQKICRSFARSRIGQVVEVLVDGIDDEGNFIGRTSLEAPETDPVVFLTDPEDSTVEGVETGQLRKCLITDTIGPGDMIAHPVS